MATARRAAGTHGISIQLLDTPTRHTGTVTTCDSVYRQVVVDEGVSAAVGCDEDDFDDGVVFVPGGADDVEDGCTWWEA